MKKKISLIKHNICDWLNKHCQEWSGRKLKVILVIFISIGSGVSLYLGARALLRRSDFAVFRRSEAPPLLMPRAYPDYHVQRSKLLFRRIEQYKKYLDSLSLHDTSKYQEVLKSNPHVLENIKSIESLFGQLIKK
jgi:hypothetical protein